MIPICESYCYKQFWSVSNYNITNDPDLWVITILQIIPALICESLQYYKQSQSWFVRFLQYYKLSPSVSHYNITNDPDLKIVTMLQTIPTPICKSYQYYIRSRSCTVSHNSVTNNPHLWVITILQTVPILICEFFTKLQIIPICESLQYHIFDPNLWVIIILQTIQLCMSRIAIQIQCTWF